MSRPRVVLNDIHFPLMDYFDWLATGLHMLAERGEIDFELRTTATTAPFRLHPKVLPLVRKVAPGLTNALSRGYHGIITGEVRVAERKVRFVYDVADSPYFFLTDALAEHDLYVKCQHPATWDERGFPLADGVFIPYHPDVTYYRDRIVPGMLGRPLSRALFLRRNRAVLEAWREEAKRTKDLALLAYFGADHTRQQTGPEGVVQARFAGGIEHPNVKRGQLVAGMRQRYGSKVDARIIDTEHADRRGPPLGDAPFHALVGRTRGNINVSGFRRSLPFRFVDSFLVGACVPTDELAVRWHRPFEVGSEIENLGKMGYELPQAVDWPRAWNVLDGLVNENPTRSAARQRRIAERFDTVWHPASYARYIVESALCRLA